MLTLFSLPQAVRYRIYSHVLSLTVEPAPSLELLHLHDAQQKVQRVLRHGNDISEVAIERIIRYPFTIYLPFAGLLRSNRTLRKELKDAMQAQKDKKLSYTLDLVIGNEIDILPTWLSCPVRTMEVQRFEMDIRLFGYVESIIPNASNGLQQHGRDRCRTLAFAIVAIIARFIERGPRFEHLRQEEIKVHSLVINFQSRREEVPAVSSRLGRANSVEEELGLMDHLTLSTAPHDNHHDEKAVGKADSLLERDLSEVVDAADLLRTVDLVLRPLCRAEKYTHALRTSHFSAAHLAFMRRNLKRVFLKIDGRLGKSLSVEG